ncbi:HNH endonuclease [Lysinibacillus xylanilyticus]|uniref:HNH endonuclease n=1 Tax=Lysinibacillus xylanilyticus TaxID=582475 RepID=UPI00380A3E12
MDCITHDKACTSDREEAFANRFNNNVNGFVYSRGYQNSDKPVLIKCNVCGTEMKRSGGFLRKVIRGEKKIMCEHCHPNNNSNKRKNLSIRNCKQCDKQFKTNLGEIYCSDECFKRNKNKRRELMKRSKFKILKSKNLYDPSITLEKLIQIEKNVCYLCGGQCDSNDFTMDDRGSSFITGSNYPSIEHVIPISKGGTHTWDNVKLAHHYCNSIKRDKKIIEDTGQMVLML